MTSDGRTPPCADAAGYGCEQESHSTAWMREGIALLEAGSAEADMRALDLFERAIALRSTGRPLETPGRAFDLAAGWMNRGEALTRLGGTERFLEALRSYDEAIPLLDAALRLRQDEPRVARRLAIAWHNRGRVLHLTGRRADLDTALTSFEQAVATLPAKPDLPDEERMIVGSAWMHRAQILVRRGLEVDYAEARCAARRALEWVAPFEETHLVCATVGMQARYLLCQVLARNLEVPASEPSAIRHWTDEATDAVDDGLRLGRIWEQRGQPSLRPLVGDLFRFGARVYQGFQPHFLVEFLLESLDPERSPGALPAGREVHAAAIEAMWRAVRGLYAEGLPDPASPRFVALLEKVGEFQGVEALLDKLRDRRAIG